MTRSCLHTTPNPAKTTLFPEEAELPYGMFPIDNSESESERQTPAFKDIDPNGMLPAIVGRAPRVRKGPDDPLAPYCN